MRTEPSEALAGRAGQEVTRFAPGLLLTACFALGAVATFRYPLNHDVSWLLSIAEQMRAGSKLYVDIIELNPPLIIWLSVPASAAADLFGIGAGNLFQLMVLALAVGCLAWAARILRGRVDEAMALPLLFLACYAALALPGYDFGQREHLTVLLAMPYLAMAVPRSNAQSTERIPRLAVALLAAVGFALKPHFLLVPLLVEALIVLRTRSRPDGSSYAIAGLMALYLGAILLLTPEYLPLAKMVARVYGNGALSAGPFAFLLTANFYIAAVGIAAAGLVRPASVLGVLSAAVIGFIGAALIQSKGWSYHWYPAAALGFIMTGLAVAAVVSRRVRGTPIVIGLAAVGLCAQAALTAPLTGLALNPFVGMLSPVIKDLGGGPVLILSNALRVSYPLVTQPGIGSSSRQPNIVLLTGAIVSKDEEFEQYLRGIVVADMLRKPPQVLIVHQRPHGLPRSFDFIEYLSTDPVFAREMTSFRVAKSVGDFRVYQRVSGNEKTPPAELRH